MVQYDRKILNGLLDSYENSRLFTGENKVSVSIDFPFNKKKIPAYFDESSYEYENIHSAMKNLEEQGLIYIVWKKGRENHIISKVVLNLENLDRAYEYVRRVPKADLVASNIAMLENCQSEYDAPVCRCFTAYLLERLRANQTVKEYMDLGDCRRTKLLLKGVYEIETNRRQCYIREFSIAVFHDSKTLQNISGRLGKIFQNFGDGFSDKDVAEILAEYGIYHTPNYVYLKGEVSFAVKDTEFQIGGLKQGIGISGDDLSEIRFCDMSAVKRVLTIENLTTFFRWEEPESLIIYLGGYHNSIRRTLLKAIYDVLPDAKYYHFGDIDAGGFEIYRDLCEKTKIPFQMYRMDLDTLMSYQQYGKELTENDRIRLKKILERSMDRTDGLGEIIRYMLENNVKLEQECILEVPVISNHVNQVNGHDGINDWTGD